jgi:hypothetical protein
MTPINSIYISRIEEEICAEYIMNAFEENELATVSRVTLIPYHSPSKYNGEKYCQAFIDIHSWHETEAAYNFIQSLKYSSEEIRFAYSGDLWWVVEVNPKPWITTMGLFEQYTTLNWLLLFNAYESANILQSAFQRATNELSAKLLQRLSDEAEWRDIEISLSEEKAYQQLENDLCL